METKTIGLIQFLLTSKGMEGKLFKFPVIKESAKSFVLEDRRGILKKDKLNIIDHGVIRGGIIDCIHYQVYFEYSKEEALSWLKLITDKMDTAVAYREKVVIELREAYNKGKGASLEVR